MENKTYNSRYYEENKERLRNYFRDYYLNNKEKVNKRRVVNMNKRNAKLRELEKINKEIEMANKPENNSNLLINEFMV